MPHKQRSKKASRRAINVTRLVMNIPRSVKEEGVLVAGESKTPAPTPTSLGSSMIHALSGYTPLPSTLRTKLKYCEQATVTGTSGVLAKNVWEAASLFDPNYTGTGHQPRGYDQLIPLYDHYVVLSSKITVHVQPLYASVCSVGGVQLNAVVTPETSWIDYAEQARCEWKKLPYLLTYGNIGPTTFHMKYIASEFMGVPDPLSCTKLQGSASANPTDGAYFHVFGQDVAESATQAFCIAVEIEYDAAFVEPVAVARS